VLDSVYFIYLPKLQISKYIHLKLISYYTYDKKVLYLFIFKFLQRSENAVEEYLEVISELLEYNEFVNDYTLVYNLTKDIRKFQKSNKEM